MAGTTISRTGKDPDALLKEMLEAIQNSFPPFQPDSDLIFLKPSTEEVRIYKIDFDNNYKAIAKQVEQIVNAHGVPIAVTVASIYGDKPKEEEWVATIHLHT